METINVKIAKDGAVEYDVKGVKGKGCKELTREIDQITGAEVLEQRNTSEFCEAPEVNHQRERN